MAPDDACPAEGDPGPWGTDTIAIANGPPAMPTDLLTLRERTPIDTIRLESRQATQTEAPLGLVAML